MIEAHVPFSGRSVRRFVDWARQVFELI